jgi:hypothetical protein
MKKLVFKDWKPAQKARINKLFKGNADDWKKDSLKGIKDALKDELLPLQKHSCAYCKRPIFSEIGRVEIDHIIPKTLAPQFTFHKFNLILSCKRCNHRKREHNTSTKSKTTLSTLGKYPRTSGGFCWVHPYIHNYDEHLRIENDCVFIAINGSANGLAVINICKLDQYKQVVSRMRSAVINRTKEPLQALIEIAGAYPNTDAKVLAQEIARVHPGVSVDKAAKQIEMLRGLDPASILK